MAIPNIKLDERSFQDLVDEAKLRIPKYTPEWTNHNVSDPGVTLIELFAYMVDQLLYQVNRVPEKSYRTFLDMIGVKLAPPNPAVAYITFRLSAPQPNTLTIPKGTEVATIRTENQQALTFTTEADLVIVPPTLKYILTTADDSSFTDFSRVVSDRFPPPVTVFPAEPQPANAFYLGFDQDIAANTLVIGLDCEKLGVGIIPEDPPLIWEYWDTLSSKWQELDIARDNTQGLTNPFAELEIYMPPTAGQREIELKNASGDTFLAWWVRCRYVQPARNQTGYNQAPVIRRFSSYTIGGTVLATHSEIIRNEELGRSTGEPGQVFTLKNLPVLALRDKEGETILVDTLEEDRPPQVWKQVPDFSDSTPDDFHFVFDPVTGQVSFGPAIRNPNGTEQQYGAIPPLNSRLVITAYRTGGGTIGNVGSETINILKSSIPYVTEVTNRSLTAGGTNAENLEQALMRGPKSLRARNRAVTAEDFEVLTREATGGVARVRCLTPGPIDQNTVDGERIEPGTVVLMIVPEVDENQRELRPEHLAIPPAMRQAISSYLDERRLLTTYLDITIPKYQWVTVQARVKVLNAFVADKVKKEVERRLYRFIRPLQGGPDPSMKFDKPGDGWQFGRILYFSEIYPLIQSIEGVEFVEKLDVFPVVDVARGQPGPAAQIINPGSRGLLVSYRHQIIITS
jgi:predicted phage baseplate assembly protein